MTADWLRHLPIAHRGLHGAGVPEDSLAAFEAAIGAGVAIELDVRPAAHGEPVVFHDEMLDRMTGAHGPVRERTSAELRALLLAGSDDRIPTLHETLVHVGGRTPLLIEVKNGGRDFERTVAQMLTESPGEFAVQSFVAFSTRRLKRLLPQTPCGLLAGPDPDLPMPQRVVTERLLLAAWVRPDFIAYDVRGSCGWARRVASKRGVPLVVWTVRGATQRATATALGANIIFERD